MITDSLLTFDSDVDTQNFVVLSSTFVARKFKDAFFWSASYLVADTSNGKRRAEHNIDNPFRLLESRYRWLLFSQHCYTCNLAEADCELGKLCTYGKRTLHHVEACKDDKCKVPRCGMLKQLLQHSRQCQANNCAICIPVWNYLVKTPRLRLSPPAQGQDAPSAAAASYHTSALAAGPSNRSSSTPALSTAKSEPQGSSRSSSSAGPASNPMASKAEHIHSQASKEHSTGGLAGGLGPGGGSTSPSLSRQNGQAGPCPPHVLSGHQAEQPAQHGGQQGPPTAASMPPPKQGYSKAHTQPNNTNCLVGLRNGCLNGEVTSAVRPGNGAWDSNGPANGAAFLKQAAPQQTGPSAAEHTIVTHVPALGVLHPHGLANSYAAGQHQPVPAQPAMSAAPQQPPQQAQQAQQWWTQSMPAYTAAPAGMVTSWTLQSAAPYPSGGSYVTMQAGPGPGQQGQGSCAMPSTATMAYSAHGGMSGQQGQGHAQAVAASHMLPMHMSNGMQQQPTAIAGPPSTVWVSQSGMPMHMQVQMTAAPGGNGSEQPTMLLQVPMVLQAQPGSHSISMVSHPQAADGMMAANSASSAPQAAVQPMQTVQLQQAPAGWQQPVVSYYVQGRNGLAGPPSPFACGPSPGMLQVGHASWPALKQEAVPRGVHDGGAGKA